MQQQSSSMSPLGGGTRITRIPPGGSTQQSNNLSNNAALNLPSARDNSYNNGVGSLNKSQNINVVGLPSSIVNAYGPQNLQSSSKQKKTSLSFLRKSNITTAGTAAQGNGGTVQA